MNVSIKNIYTLKKILLICLTLIGSKIVAQKQIYIYINSEKETTLFKEQYFSDSLSAIKFLQNIQNKDFKNGYALAGFDSIIHKNDKIFAYYNKGLQFNIGQFSIESDDNIKIKSPKPDKLVNDKIYSLLNLYLDYYTNNGFPFAKIQITDFIINNNFIDISVKIDKGNFYVFDNLEIKGNAKITEHYIRKTSGLRPKEKFSNYKLQKFEKEINSIIFLEQDRPMQLAFSDSTVDILLYLKKRNNSSFNGFIGFIPNKNNTGKLAITGDINLMLVNSFGLGDFFGVKWQKYENLSQILQLNGSIPFMLKTDFGPGISLNIEKRDTSYITTDFTAKIIYGSNIGNGMDFLIQSIRSRILGAENLTTNLKNYNLNLYGINYRYSKTDNFRMAQKGHLINISTLAGQKTYTTETEKSLFSRADIDVSLYIPIYRFINLKLRNKTTIIYSNTLSNNELDFIGGLNSIRGFNDRSIPAAQYSFLNAELRYLFDNSSAIFIFTDYGITQKRFTIENSTNYLFGTGIGIELQTNAGLFSIVFANGTQNNQAFNFSTSKIHFGYKSVF
ncbi:MAG: ShlB/FhaC/HecB family hemolysin secretion/activation protein [Endomicrobiia bacterium]